MKQLALVLVLWLPACGLIPDGSSSASKPGPITNIDYRVWLRDVGAREIEVELRFKAPGHQQVTLGLPAWTLVPEIRDLRRFVTSLTARDGVGRSLEVQFRSKDLWQITLQGNEDVQIRYRVKATDRAPTGNQVTDDFAYLVGGATFVYILEAFDVPVTVAIEPHAEWQIVTTLESTPEAGIFRADRYEVLLEHPIALGQFRYLDFEISREVGGVSRTIRMQLAVDTHDERYASNLAALRDQLREMTWGHLQLMRDFPFLASEKYTFLILLDESAVVDGFGFPRMTVLTGAPSNLGTHDQALLRVASREFGHVWFGGRVPKGEASPDVLGREFYGMVYWVLYGWSAYYGDLVLLRAGLLDEETFLTGLTDDITALRACQSRTSLSPAASSYLIWFYRYGDWAEEQQGVHPRRVGRLLALALDLFLRETTLNNKNLDTVVRELKELFGNARRTLTIMDVIDALTRNLGQAVLRRFGKHIYGTDEPEWDEYLRWVGMHLQSEVIEAGADSGFEFREVFPGRFFIESVASEGPARKFGLAVGDEILSIDGEPGERTAERMAELAPGENLELQVRHADGRVEEYTVDVRARLIRELHISDLSERDTTPAQRETWRNNRRSWLSSGFGRPEPEQGSDSGSVPSGR